MKANELLQLGFKPIKEDEFKWFELHMGNHHFITCDNSYNEGKDNWNVGYSFKDEDSFWFNNRLKDVGEFKTVFHVLTGKYLRNLTPAPADKI